MLVQLPRGPAEAAEDSSTAEECTAFEAALRRDLATPLVVHYDPILGGRRKRAFDLILVVCALPLWAPIMLGVALWSSYLASTAVFSHDDRVGYGGRCFRRFALRVGKTSTAAEPPVEAAAPDAPANDLEAIAEHAEDRRAKWRRLFERLPQLINVLLGDMSLVGPEPLRQGEIEQLRSGKRYYLSARPGVFGIGALVRGEQSSGPLKAYSLSWSVWTDLSLIWDGVRGFRDRGELWQPSLKFSRVVPGLTPDDRRAEARRPSTGA